MTKADDRLELLEKKVDEIDIKVVKIDTIVTNLEKTHNRNTTWIISLVSLLVVTLMTILFTIISFLASGYKG